MPGVEGDAGIDGSNGVNAFSLTTADFVIPATGSNVTVAVPSEWMGVGQEVFVEGPVHMLVVSTPTTTSAVLQALGEVGDLTAGNTVPTGSKVSPSGVPGTSGGVSVVNIFQGTTTYTPSAGTKRIYVECFGAGGSGGGAAGTADASAGSGGGGGAYSAVFLSSLKTSYTVSVGAGGAAPSAGANNGNDGGDTTFDVASVCTAKGGGMGLAGAASGTAVGYVAGGSAAAASGGVGDLKLDGSAGGAALRLSGTVASGGFGGPGPLGGIAAAITGQGSGVAGKQYGGGGSGGCSVNGGAATAGGAGGDGLIRIWEFS